jgi:ABC-type transport system involved in multi-copper enzyme maturation permease subunit
MAMAMHIGPGPVFICEWQRLSRRWQMYLLRSLFVLGLLAAICFAWIMESPFRSVSRIKAQAELGGVIFYAVIGVQLTLVLLAAPAATAGAICLDKARGALIHLLVTDLSASEIVLGKLLAYLVPVFGLVLGSVPVLYLCTFLGGIDPEALAGAELVTVGVVVTGCTLALLLSVWCKKPYEVILVVYAIWIVLLLIGPIYAGIRTALGVAWTPPWLELLNPYLVAFLPYLRPRSATWREPAAFLTVSFILSFLMMTLASVRIRAVAIRQSSQIARSRIAWRWLRMPALFRPSLDRNPVLWREWHYRKPGGWVRMVWIFYAALALFFTISAAYQAFGNPSPMRSMLPTMVNAVQVGIGLLLLSVLAVTTLSDERVRGNLEVLLPTPLPTYKIVWGKWWGTYRTVARLALLPVLLCAFIEFVCRPTWPTPAPRFVAGAPFAVDQSRWVYVIVLALLLLAYGAGITSLGLALAISVARSSRGIALSVGCYIFACVGWPLLLAVSSPAGPGNTIEVLLPGSPLIGTGAVTELLCEPRIPREQLERLLGGSILWIVVYGIFAVFLYYFVLRSFDWYLGRITLKRAQRIPSSKRYIPDLVPVPAVESR